MTTTPSFDWPVLSGSSIPDVPYEVNRLVRAIASDVRKTDTDRRMGDASTLAEAKGYTDAEVSKDRRRLTAAELAGLDLGERVDSLEVLGGLAPGDVSDETIAGVVRNPESATSRALETRPPYAGRLVINPRAGAITAELQARLDDAAENGGGTVEIPDAGGELAVTATLRHGADTRIVGQSKGTRLGAIGNFPVFASKDPSVRMDNVEISQLEIRRYGSGSTTPIIDWTGVSHSAMRSVKIEQGTAPAGSVGVLLGLNSYYNQFDAVQARKLGAGFRMQDQANGNRFTGGTLALFCSDGFVVDNSNGNAFLGAAAEMLTGTGFDFVNGAKMNQVIGCRIENMPIGIRAKWSDNPAFANFFIGNSFYIGEGQVDYDVQTDNVVIDRRHGLALKNLLAATQRTFVDAYKNTAQGSLPINTWTRVPFQSYDTDHLGELNTPGDLPDGPATFTAKAAGIYTVSATALFPTTTAGNDIELALYKNGTLFKPLGKDTSAGAGDTRVSGYTQLTLAAGDRLDVYARASQNVGIRSGRVSTNLQITRNA